MDLLLFNVSWMIVNISLALISVVLTLFILNYKKNPFTGIVYFFWFIFLPNTIYTVTDLQYSLNQFIHASGVALIIFLLFQYSALVLIGILAYFYSMKPLELLVKKVKKSRRTRIIIFVNFLISFAIVIGKIQRTESWYLVTNPARVIHDIIMTIESPASLIFFIITGLLINGLYFGVKKLPKKS